jgi:hypothetical protein
MMFRLPLWTAIALVSSSCAAWKSVQLTAAETVQPRVTSRITALGRGPVEVVCGTGELCAEVEVIHVQRNDAGTVDVTLRNRSGEHVALQLSLEAFDDDAHRTDKTGFHDVILAPRGEDVLSVATATSTKDTLVVHLRARRG